MTWTAPEVARVDEPFLGDERAMLSGFLEWGRSSLLVKCAGLTGEQLARPAVPPSNLSLLGLVRHLTDVERTWFRRRFAGEPVPTRYWRPDAPDAAFEELDPERADEDFAAYLEECDAARAAIANLPLDHVFVSPRWGEMSLRWAYCHMHGEYSQHNGHADLLRQRIDGRTGH